MSSNAATAPQHIPRRETRAPERPAPARHLRLVDTERRKRERRRRWIVRLWAVGIVSAALVGVMVHAFMAEGQVRADRLAARIQHEEARYDDARLTLAQREAPRVITARAARLGLVPGSDARTVAVPGVDPGSSVASRAATRALQSVKRVLDGAP